jgi:hypothetical protein
VCEQVEGPVTAWIVIDGLIYPWLVTLALA